MESLTQITEELKKSNLSQEKIISSLESFSPVLSSSVAETALEDTIPFYNNIESFTKDIEATLKASGMDFPAEELMKSLNTIESALYKSIAENGQSLETVIQTTALIETEVARLRSFMTGNKLQDEENRREMIDVLKDIAESNVKPPPIKLPKEDKGSLFGGILGLGTLTKILRNIKSLGKILPKSIEVFKKMFSKIPVIGKFLDNILPKSITSKFKFFASNMGKFGKGLTKFSKLLGPIGIAISVITGIVGAIKGGMKGYSEEGVAGMFKEGIVGLVDALIGDLIKMLGNGVGWLLEKFGFKNSGEFGSQISQIVDGIYDNFRNVFDLVVGLFSLDSDKFISSFKKIFTNIADNILDPLGNLLINLFADLLPMIGKVLKGIFWDLPIFLWDMSKKLFNWLQSDGPGFIEKFKLFFNDVVKAFITDILPKVKENIAPFLTLIDDKISELAKPLSDWISKMIIKTREWIDPIIEKITNGLETGRDVMNFVADEVTALFDGIKEIFNSVRDILSNPKESIKKLIVSNPIIEFHKKILRTILPKEDKNGNWYDPVNLLAKAIPKAVYDYAEVKSPEEIAEKKLSPKMEALRARAKSGENVDDEMQVLQREYDIRVAKPKISEEELSMELQAEKLKIRARRGENVKDEMLALSSLLDKMKDRKSTLYSTTGGKNIIVERKIKANAAGFKTWADYEKSGFAWRPNVDIKPMVNDKGSFIASAGSKNAPAPIIINQMGGNVSNTNVSTVTNSTTPFEVIETGRGMGFMTQ